MKVAILWTRLSGYLNACMKELAGREGVELFVSHEAFESNAPFDESQFAWIANRFTWRTKHDLNALDRQLRTFAPDIIISTGWHVPGYRRIAREFANRCPRVMTMDNCWLATWKQRVGTWLAPYLVRPLADAVWLPGERQAEFARRLGFEQRRIFRGLYTCDCTAFEAAYLARVAGKKAVKRSFLFIGRLIPEKGIDALVEAYRIYRAATPNAWPLICCGTGPLRSRLEGKEGIRIEGFVQPECLPAMLMSVGCLILASKFEPWAVVVHEAASAGLLILSSDKVGAAVHLVQPGFNGYIFDSGDTAALASLMSEISALSDVKLDKMSRASYTLSRQFSPKQWADTLIRSYCVLAQTQAAGSRSALVRK